MLKAYFTTGGAAHACRDRRKNQSEEHTNTVQQD